MWPVIPEPIDGGAYYCIPHTAPGGIWMMGGPSNAGGLFLDWVTRLLGGDAAADAGPPADPRRVPVWVPYPRGERVPLNDPDRRAQLVDLDLTHGPAAVRRAAFEASGFVGAAHDRRVARGRRAASSPPAVEPESPVGWKRSPTRTGLPVHVCAVPEGGALGAAFLARMAAGLETTMTDAAQWARTSRVVDPDPAWVERRG